MERFLLPVCILLICVSTISAASTGNDIVKPEVHFGFKPGADRKLIDYEELMEYLRELASASSRIKLVNIGKSPMGRDIYTAFISSQENIARLEELREINRALALDYDIPEEKLEDYIEKGRVFFTATLSMHSNEVGPSQSAPLIAYRLVKGEAPRIDSWLDDVVYMMVPCHNPDGMDMVVQHYRRYLGTRHEGSRMPGIYHKYVGHDNNRDFINLSQSDTRAISFLFSRSWFPQVMVEKHQMGSSGVRYFVPPNHDPIAENIDAGIWNWAGVFGANMMKDMSRDELAGVSQHYLFDDYWPGSTETCIWKNVIGFLTECASAQHATPVYVEPGELRVSGKGLSEYKKSINMPLPWEGGWWKLSDIVEYEAVSTMSAIKTCSLHREDILRFRNELCRREVNRGLTRPPCYYILPPEQHDRSALAGLVNLLLDHGIYVSRLDSRVIIDETVFDKGSIVIPLAQPFRPFIKEVMERQRYPVRRYTPGGEIIKPYEITSWSLPLNRGLECHEIEERSMDLEGKLSRVSSPFRLFDNPPGEFVGVILPARYNQSYRAAFQARRMGLDVYRIKESYQSEPEGAGAGSFLIYTGDGGEKIDNFLKSLTAEPLFIDHQPEIEKSEFDVPRIGLVETWFHDMNAGWTRFVLDSHDIPYRVIRPAEIKDLDLDGDFDVLIFCDRHKDIIMSGKRKGKGGYGTWLSGYPPEYREGMGKDGFNRVLKFINRGGIVVSWGGSADLFSGVLEIREGKETEEEFQLPFRNVYDHLKEKGFYSPGSTMRLLLEQDHPLTYGMQEEIGIMFRGGPVFATSIPRFDMDRKVIGKFPERDILMSGYSENEKYLAKRAAMIWLKKGDGQLVLFGFRPQFRASTPVSYKLIFNALLLEEI